jgi:hypothetical protein
MNPDTKKELIELLGEMSKNPKILNLPPPPPIMDADSSLWYHKKQVKCACGQKTLSMDECRIVKTGYISALDTVCSECFKDVKDTCPIVCIPCKKVTARLEPNKDKDGFEYERGKAYHIDACPTCDPNINSSMVVEKIIYNKERKKL